MTGTRKSRGSYVAGAVTRESILDVATRLIAENGYYGFSLRDVARLVGISHPAVIYHFPTKEILLFAASHRCEKALGIFDVEFDADDGRLDHNGLKAEAIGDLGLSILELATREDYRTMTRFDLTLAVEAAASDHPLHSHYRKKFLELEEFLTTEIRILAEKGIADLPVTSEAAARRFISSWYGNIAAEKYLNHDEDGPDAVGMFLAMVGRFLSLNPDTILSIAVSVPEHLANVFQKVIRVNQRLNP